MKENWIPAIPPSTTKSIRFPNGLIEDVERVIQENGGTFTAFVVNAGREALMDNSQIIYCTNRLCMFWREGSCSLQYISVDKYGRCEAYSQVVLEEALLRQKREERLGEFRRGL